MKKLTMLCLCGLAAVSMVTGCSNSSTDGKENLGTVELAEYQGVKVNIPVPQVTEDEVESRVNQALTANPKETEVDRAAETGDVVNIDYVGTQDGVEFANGKAEDTDLILGSGRFIEGFEDGLIGAKAGDKRELNLTFPEDYDEAALAGKSVVFQVTVNAVKSRETSELNDEFVQRISDYETVDEYRDSIRQDLMREKMQSFDLAVQQAVLQQVIDGSKFKLNKSTVSRRYNANVDQFNEQAKIYGTNLAGLAQANGMDEGGFKESIYASVEDDIKNQLVINTIAANEGIVLEDADKESFAQTYGQSAEDVAALYGQEAFDQMALNYKVMKYLGDSAVNEASDNQTGETGAAEEAETTAAETEAAEEAETTAAETEAAEEAETTAAEAETTAAQ